MREAPCLRQWICIYRSFGRSNRKRTPYWIRKKMQRKAFPRPLGTRFAYRSEKRSIDANLELPLFRLSGRETLIFFKCILPKMGNHEISSPNFVNYSNQCSIIYLLHLSINYTFVRLWLPKYFSHTIGRSELKLKDSKWKSPITFRFYNLSCLIHNYSFFPIIRI